MVQHTVSVFERQGSVVRILRSLLFIYLFIYFLVYFIITFHFDISFHLFIIIFLLYAFLIMIFPLLVSGVRVGRLCWVGQEPAVFAAVG